MKFFSAFSFFIVAIAFASANAQTYKGIFVGTNTTKIVNVVGLNTFKQGFVLGYLMPKWFEQARSRAIGIAISYEDAGSNSINEFRVVTCYLKAPLITNFKLANTDGNSSIRFLIGAQPTFYMGGYAKFGKIVYRPRLWKDDDNRYFQPDFNYFEDGKYSPRNWNLEFTGGVEFCKKGVNYGIRAAFGFFSKERFQNSSISFRLGF